MKKFNLTVLATSLTLICLAPAGAADAPRLCAYAYDAAGNLVRDSAGDCVRTPNWTPAAAIAECEPDMVKPEPKAEPEPVAMPKPKPAPKPVYQTLTLGAGALFDINSADLKPEGMAELDRLVADLRQMRSVQSIQIAGHTDSIGDAGYNQDLSMRRANAVKNYLLDKGVDPSLIATRGHGEDKPVADNSTREGRAKNRRVEITIVGDRRVQ